MVGIVFATHREAAPFLSLASAEPLAERPFPLYQASGRFAEACLASISGMGKVAAAVAAAHLVMDRKVKTLISAGLCGRLARYVDWTVGDLFRITSAVEGDCDRFGRGEIAVDCDPRWFGRLEPARLVTCDRPVFEADRRERMAAMGDLADMEGAAVARAAGCYGIPCAMIKGISDAADEAGRQAVASHIDWVSARIATALMDELAQTRIDRK